ncbi:MAG: hypothetical protein M3R53_04690, partial [Candidatus Eremiobacteraeota bacterium]|nr:hypothetical protein [Candidatus Eremiobacteraeota bacterium]
RRISADLTLNDPAHLQIAGGPINPDVSGAEFYDTTLDIAPSPRAAGQIWVGTDDGLVQLTRDGGRHWKNVSVADVAPYGRVETVEPSHVFAGRAYVAIDRHLSGDFAPYLFVTQDYGKHWRSLRANLPNGEPAHVIREDRRNPSVLYAGFEQGVRISFDGGTSWSGLRLDMPPVAVHDLRVQPRANDLVLATHGRGFYILDDLTPLQQWSYALARTQPTLFTPRRAYRFAAGYDYGVQADACCVAPGEAVGKNPPAGAILSYYLTHASRARPVIELKDAGGHIVRRMLGTGSAGINRIVWNLTEDAPEPWLAARSWNRGPSSGPEVVPGLFTVSLLADRAPSQRASIAVLPDPRSHWTRAEMTERRDFLRALYGEMSYVDRTLNALDALGLRLAAHRDAALERRRKRAYARFTSGPVNSEDQLLFADGLRERLQTLLTDVSLSQSPPSGAHRTEAAHIRALFLAARHAYERDTALLAATRAAPR